MAASQALICQTLLSLREKNDADGNPRDVKEVALEEFRRLNKTHHPKPLPDEVVADLDRILAAAEREAEQIG